MYLKGKILICPMLVLAVSVMSRCYCASIVSQPEEKQMEKTLVCTDAIFWKSSFFFSFSNCEAMSELKKIVFCCSKTAETSVASNYSRAR